MKRRLFLKLTALSSTLSFGVPLWAQEPKKKVLYYDYSSGYIHEPTRDHGGKTGICGTFFKTVGEKHGLEVICTKDGNIFAEDLTRFSAIILYTSGDLYVRNPHCPGNPVPAGTQEKLVDAVRAGVGLLSLHPTTDSWRCNGTSYVSRATEETYRNDPVHVITPFTKLVGGQFIMHGPQQEAEVFFSDPVELPSLKAVPGKSYRCFEEWYCMKNFNPDMHVYLTLNTQGMTGDCYSRPPFPVVWARQEEKGVSAYSAFGHGPRQWNDPFIQSVSEDLLLLVTGKISTNLTPNMKTACPNAAIAHF